MIADLSKRSHQVYDEPIGPGPSVTDRPSKENLKAAFGMGRDAEAYPRGTYPEASSGGVYHEPAQIGDTRSLFDVMTGAEEKPGILSRNAVAGEPPMGIPAAAPIAASGKIASALGDAGKIAQGAMRMPEMIAKPLMALDKGKTVGHALGRTALAGTQGMTMSALEDRKEGESWADTLDRIEHAGKLSGGIQAVAESLPYIGKLAKFAGTKAAAALTGESDQVIKTYANQTDDVNRIIKSTGGKTEAAYDNLRVRLAKGLENAKERINQSIGKTLETNPGKAIHEVDKIVKELEGAKKGIDPDLFPEALEQIDDLVARVKKVADRSGGKVSAKDLNGITQYLQDAAESAYNKGGQVFIRAKESAKAAKGGAAVSRQARNQASPELAADYAELQRIRGATKHANKNLLAEGKSDAALNAAGSGQNSRNEKVLESLGKIAGVDALGEAQRIAAARSFASPNWFPTGSNGKTAGRIILGAGTGYAIDGEKGAMIGAGLTSPAMLKIGINTANYAKAITSRFPQFGKMIRENPVAAQTIIQLTSRQIRRANEPAPKITPEVQQFFEQNPKLMMDVRDPEMRAKLEKGRSVSGSPAHSPKISQPGAVILYQGKHYKVGADGDTLTTKGGASKKLSEIKPSDVKPMKAGK
jgi:hypothetical protein